MTPSPKDTEPALDGQVARATFRDFVQEQVRQAIRATFIDILEEEVSQFIGADRYERERWPSRPASRPPRALDWHHRRRHRRPACAAHPRWFPHPALRPLSAPHA